MELFQGTLELPDGHYAGQLIATIQGVGRMTYRSQGRTSQPASLWSSGNEKNEKRGKAGNSGATHPAGAAKHLWWRKGVSWQFRPCLLLGLNPLQKDLTSSRCKRAVSDRVTPFLRDNKPLGQ